MSEVVVEPLCGAMGAEIRGVSLANQLDESVARAIHQAFLDHVVLVFRDQQLSPSDHQRFAEHFGTLFVHPYLRPLEGHPYVHEVRKEPETATNFGGVWHTDASFLETPVKMISLYAREIPRAGGDTLFVNQYRTYEALSPAMRAMLEGLKLVHELNNAYDEFVEANPGATNAKVARSRAVHPVVRTHPESGRKCLFWGGEFAKCFDGMTLDESRPLLDWLHRHVQRPEFQLRHVWRNNDFVIWDNRCSMHYPLNDYPNQRRVLHRAFMLETSRPV